jgi:AcrR family transcriptional regulator
MLLTRDEKKLDPRVKRTRELLQRALMELMAEKGFEAITVRDIAERATINRVTFYAHFQDKYELLEYTMRELIRDKLRSQVPEGTPFSSENLARLIQTVCEFLVEMGRHCRPPHGQMDQLMEKEIKAAIYEVLRPWVADLPRNGGRRPTQSDQATVAASWAMYGMAVQWSDKEPREPAPEFVQQALPLILALLQPPAGQAKRT